MSSPLSAAMTYAFASGGLARRVGTLSSTSPLLVTLANGSTLNATGRLSSYTPSNGDVVLLMVDDGGSAIILGRLVSP